MNMIIGLAGRSGSGKTTAAIMLQDLGFEPIAFAEPLKRALAAMFDEDYEMWEGNCKNDIIPDLGITRRSLMQTLGTDWGQNIVDNNIWIKLAERKLADKKLVVFTDVRFDTEADWVRERGGKILHIDRDGLQVMDHESERGIERKNNDIVVYNNGSFLELFNNLAMVLPLRVSYQYYLAADKPIPTNEVIEVETLELFMYPHLIPANIISAKTVDVRGYEHVLPDTLTGVDTLICGDYDRTKLPLQTLFSGSGFSWNDELKTYHRI